MWVYLKTRYTAVYLQNMPYDNDKLLELRDNGDIIFSRSKDVPRCAKSHWLQMIAKDSRLPQGTSMIHQNGHRASTFGPSPS